ncbi:MAG: TonB-dependent receptor [Xanthomonadaceae bacterium]|jgi:iron complex outermembrane receptor protein|nr:TonB-dependent receptor [Xanthomonadaceae bacterium]MDE3072496.1 TonB-dependent receptor [Pseudomonadota bacterium]
MSYRKTLLAASIVAGLCLSGALNAQDAAATHTAAAKPAVKKKSDIKEMNTVIVTGIRNSEQLSLETKQDANSHVEVVSAVDIGKLPARNVADTIAQLPGVNIADAAGAEGGFDEADRASIRGSAPSLTLTTVNGHALASGDWFVVGGGGTRSVSYSLLPSEIVSQVVVHKSSEASLLEGGAAGSIDILTRKPLEFGKPFSAEASVGAVYADLPGSTKPQFNGLVNWKNDDNTFGVMLQGFYEERSLQRDGQEILGYSYIPAGSAVAQQLGLTDKGHGSTGVFYPNLPGAALFTQERKRKGASIDLEWKPLDNLTLNLDGFYSKMDATDYNRNYMLFTRARLPGDTLTSYTISGNVLTSAGIAAKPGLPQGIYDMISRPGESESSAYLSLDAVWQATENLDFKFQGGTTRGTGNTPTQNVMEMDTGYGQSASYAMNGLGTPLNWTLGGINNTYNPATVGLDWIFGEQDVHVIDKEHWLQADGEYDFDDAGPLSSLQFGARYDRHTHDSPTDVAQGPNWGSNVTFSPNATIWPASTGNYPGSFAGDLGVGQMPSNIWYWSASQLAALNAQYANRAVTGNTSSRLYPNGIYAMTEKDSALYFQANFSGDRWGGNAGLRYVSTNENVGYTSPSILESSYSGPYLNSAFYPSGWYMNHYKTHYGKLLPSFNLRFNLNDDGSLLARFAASQTLTRQDYGQLAGFVSLTDPLTAGPLGSGSGPNPYLKPLISTNFDASLEWYFAKRGLLSASVYEMDMHDYYDYGAVTRTYLNNYLTYGQNNPSHTPVYSNYLVSVPVNVDGTLKGVELNYIQPIGDHFGAQLNYTYSNGHSSGGTYLYNADGTLASNVAAGSRPLFGTSKSTANLSAFYEDSHWNARINYTYRSAFYDGMMSNSGAGMPLLPYWQAGTGYLSFSAGYTLNDHVSFSFDAMNLNNPTLRYYIKGSQAGLGFDKAPEAFYVNGRQYYLNVNFKF